MTVVKYYFVCKQHLPGIQRRSKNKLIVAIENFKVKNPATRQSVEDLSSMYAVMDVEKGNGDVNTSKWI